MGSTPLAAVVGMKAENHKRKLHQYGFQHRNQPEFGDLRDSRHDLPLRDLIHRSDVIDALAAILIALMHGVDAQVSRCAVRLWLAPFPDRDRRGPSRLVTGMVFAISRRVAQSIEVRHRKYGQANVGPLPIFFVLAL